jgi:starvation-inducible DNA-binding protein
MNVMNEELVNALKVALANAYAVYFKAHGYHWNVEGINFKQYHLLFEDIYSDVYESVDLTAEYIRAQQAYAPFKMSRFVELTNVPETEIGPDPASMSQDLLESIQIAIIDNLIAFNIATKLNEQGVANFLAERDALYKKWSWQLRASIK